MFAIGPAVAPEQLANPPPRKLEAAPAPDPKGTKPVIDGTALEAVRSGELAKRKAVLEAIRSSKDRRGTKHLECALSLLFSTGALRPSLATTSARRLGACFLAAQRKMPHSASLREKAAFIVRELARLIKPEGMTLPQWASMLEKQMDYVGADRAGEADPAKRDVRPWCPAVDGPLPS